MAFIGGGSVWRVFWLGLHRVGADTVCERHEPEHWLAWFGVWGLGFRVSGFGFRISDFGCGV